MYIIIKVYCEMLVSTGCKKTNFTYMQKVHNDKNKSVKIEFPFIVYNVEVYTLFYFNIQAARVFFLHLVLESIKRHCSSLVTYWHNGRTSLVPIIVKVALAINVDWNFKKSSITLPVQEPENSQNVVRSSHVSAQPRVKI